MAYGNRERAAAPGDGTPGGSEITLRERYLYGISGGLSEAALDVLWGDVSEEANDAA